MRMMIRGLFAESAMTPTLDGKGGPGVDGAEIISNIPGAALNPAQIIGPVVIGAARMLDDMIDTTPGAARMLMAYTIGTESS